MDAGSSKTADTPAVGGACAEVKQFTLLDIVNKNIEHHTAMLENCNKLKAKLEADADLGPLLENSPVFGRPGRY